MMKFERNYRICGLIKCLTGLHIGGIAEELKIGGTDSPVIMDSVLNLPYIPGSSLKGKMRSLLEVRHSEDWLMKNGDVHTCSDPSCDLCATFGRSAAEKIEGGPTRIIVRDSYPNQETRAFWDSTEDILHGTEVKGENFLNRITSMATPRFIERVPAGSSFDLEIIFSQYGEDDKKRLKLVLEAMTLLEDNYLGASGSRGYGKIRFTDLALMEKTVEDYRRGADWKPHEKTKGATTAREILGLLSAE